MVTAFLITVWAAIARFLALGENPGYTARISGYFQNAHSE